MENNGERKNNTQNNTELELQSNIEEIQNGTEKPKNKKTDLYIELALFLVLGFLLGIAIKTEALKTMAIGFNDYQMKIKKQDFNINKMQMDLALKQKEQKEQGQSQDQNQKN